MRIGQLFSTLARKASCAVGTPWMFGLALATVLAWGLSGPLFGFNHTWQLVINTGTTIATFLMVFLVQHTQNVDSAALHLKLDELIRATRAADDMLLDMEELPAEELEKLRKRYEALAEKARRQPRVHGSRSPVGEADEGDGPGQAR